MTTRRGFLGLLGAGAAFAMDPERALWVPGAKTISIPKPMTGLHWLVIDTGIQTGRVSLRNTREAVRALSSRIETLGYKRFEFVPLTEDPLRYGAEYCKVGPLGALSSARELRQYDSRRGRLIQRIEVLIALR